MNIRWWIPAILLLSVPACDYTEKEPSDQANSLDILYSDMTRPHEGVLNGVPEYYTWSKGPRMGMGNTPPPDWSAVIPWGGAYRDTDPVTATNTRIQLKNLQAWYLDTENRWQKWTQSDSISGRYFYEDFRDDINLEADVRQEPDGGISFRMAEGYNFHFWSAEGRFNMQPSQIRGVWICVDARLIVHDTSKPDDRHRANFLLGSGGDYWKSETAPWDNFISSGDIAVGRMKYVGKGWKPFNTHTLTPAQLRASPPPF